MLTNPPIINGLIADDMRIAIDGWLQRLVNRIDVRTSRHGGTRIYVRWCVPESRLEWDGRESAYHGRTHGVTVVSGESVVAHGNARVAHFAVGQVNPAKMVVARAVLMLDGPPAEKRDESTAQPTTHPKRDPFGYEGKP